MRMVLNGFLKGKRLAMMKKNKKIYYLVKYKCKINNFSSLYVGVLGNNYILGSSFNNALRFTKKELKTFLKSRKKTRKSLVTIKIVEKEN